jgi:ketosteroid isomerase-like protein
MERWEAAWQDKDLVRLAERYALDAVVLHPNKPIICGREAIGAFFAGGLDKLTLAFRPAELKQSGEMAFEWGEFHDLDRLTGTVVAAGSYVVVWVRSGDEWLVQSHAWNSLRK